MKEVWKDIPGYEGLYKVSNYGDIKSLNHNRRGVVKSISQHADRKGYLRVKLYKDKKMKTAQVHRIVMLAFIGPSDLQVNHKDWCTSNNRLDNLEYCTDSENKRHAYSYRRSQRKVKSFDQKADRIIHFAKLKANDIRRIRLLLDKGVHKNEIASDYGVSVRCIRAIETRENWAWVK